jgi:hypothetical protein
VKSFVTKLLLVALALGVAACDGASRSVGSSENSRELTKQASDLHKKCMTSIDEDECEKAINYYNEIMPKLRQSCVFGDQYACGLFPGYDSGPKVLRMYVDKCINYELPSDFENVVSPEKAVELEEIIHETCKLKNL